MMEPTDGELHAGCLGNINATWTFHGRSGHSARPWDGRQRDPRGRARHRRARARLEPERARFDGLTFHEVASVTKIEGGIAMNVIPDSCVAHVNFRYAPGRTPRRPRRGCASCAAGGELEIDRQLAARAPVALDHPLARS